MTAPGKAVELVSNDLAKEHVDPVNQNKSEFILSDNLYQLARREPVVLRIYMAEKVGIEKTLTFSSQLPNMIRL